MMPNETTNTPILTLDSDAKLETAQSISDLTWHEIPKPPSQAVYEVFKNAPLDFKP